MAFSDGSSVPLSVHTESASPHEVTLVGPTLANAFLKEKPERLIGDKAYDSDPLDETLREEGIEMIAPHRKNRKKKKARMDASSGATRDVGRLSVYLPGYRTSGGW
jgi:IS5 family transposase